MTKIDWTDRVWNPAWGCRNYCPYCYAWKFAKRGAGRMAKKEYDFRVNAKLEFMEREILQSRFYSFNPTFIYSQYGKKFPKKPCRIFVDSMSDIAFWKPEWMRWVLKRITVYPQHTRHTFQFLTKQPEIYHQYYFPVNCWLGVTIVDNNDMCKLEAFDYLFNPNYEKKNLTFVSFEPLQEHIDMSVVKKHQVDWVIIGAETGNRKGKIVPKHRWIEDTVDFCRYLKIPVFLKDNLKEIWKADLIQEFPEVNHD